MDLKERFSNHIIEGYLGNGNSIIIVGGILNNEFNANNFIRIPLKTLNRYELIMGVKGIGKMKTVS